MPPGLRAADFSLTDQTGHRVTLSRYRGHVVILTFIHRCATTPVRSWSSRSKAR